MPGLSCAVHCRGPPRPAARLFSLRLHASRRCRHLRASEGPVSPLDPVQDSGGFRSWAAQGLAVVTALALLALAVLVDRDWLVRHILPEFFEPRTEQFQTLRVVRGVA